MRDLTEMTEKEQIQNQIQELQEKLKKLEEVENGKMEFKNRGKFHFFYYNGTPYYRLEYTDIPTVWWFESLSTLEPFQIVHEKVMDSKLKKKLEELFQKQIAREEPEENEWKNVALRFGEKLSDNGPYGYYDFTPDEWMKWAISEYNKEKPEENEWKNVALEFGKKLPVILPHSYNELSANSWFRWAVFTYDKYMEYKDEESGYGRSIVDGILWET